MNIAYSTDENYAVHAYISLHSLLDSNIEEKEIHIYLIDNRLSNFTRDAFKQLLKTYSTEERIRTLSIIDFTKYEEYVKDAVPCGSLSTYGRLFLSNLMDIDKILYIDCDTIVSGSLHELFEMDIEGYALAGVQDIVSLSIRKATGLGYGERYINAGVSLMNLKYWRENKGQEQCLNFIKRYGGKVPFEDQGTMNGVFRGKIKILPPKFNVMNVMIDYSAEQISTYMRVENYYSNSEILEANRDSRIIHFTAGYYLRPWYKNSNHPKAPIYNDYRMRSPWNQLEYSVGPAITLNAKVNRLIKMKTPLSLYKAIQGAWKGAKGND